MKTIRYKTLFSTVALFVICFVGCKQTEVVDKEDPTLAISEYPVRVWIATPISDIPIIQRQWQAVSEQPIELKQVAVEDLLGEKNPEADVILFPARLLGDLIAKGAIQYIPKAATTTEDGQETMPALAAERTQAEYDGKPYGVSLGCSIPVAVASNKLPELSSAPTGWDSLLEMLETSSEGNDWPDVVNDEALVDRYLFILATLVEKNSTYGVFFDMLSMKPRLQAPEFENACRVLKRLTEQPGGRAAFLGSHSAAWIWASQNSAPVLGIACPAELSPEAIAIKEGAIVDIKRANLIGWNSGGGVVAALSATCQQTSHSVEVLKWLLDSKTRSIIAPLATGIEADIPDVELLAWKARDSYRVALDSDTLPAEPSLPQTPAYRKALAEQLLAFLRGDIEAGEAMSRANEAWENINKNNVDSLGKAYEMSLGL